VYLNVKNASPYAGEGTILGAAFLSIAWKENQKKNKRVWKQNYLRQSQGSPQVKIIDKRFAFSPAGFWLEKSRRGCCWY
jgi:hypothetical protein